ncbi:MAG: MFS transporter [Anaerolineales bacterium]
MKKPSLAPLRGQLSLFLITRIILDTGFRMVYPFLPTLARALGVDISAISLAITARSSLGILSPFIGSAGDSMGRKSAMLMGLSIFAGGSLVVLLWPSYIGFLIALLLGSLGKVIFDPAMQAYLGDRVPYNLRGRAIAITEIGWSGAALVGLPIIGWIIYRSNWVAPFPILGILAALAAFFVWRAIPSDSAADSERPTLMHALRTILSRPSTLAALTVSLLINIGNESINVIYGLWLENSFGLHVVALGAASVLIGLAELSGVGLVARLADQLGKIRALCLGIISITVACLLLPFLGVSLIPALIGLFLFYLTFEFTFVTLISLFTELEPSARATLMATSITAAAGGRALGALIGPALFDIHILASSVFGAAMAIIALPILIVWVKVE